ncbi:MAG: radical SAM protein [DPANN group archaeon]|nr:radical SAM protein [DPANN group archaeon]
MKTIAENEFRKLIRVRDDFKVFPKNYSPVDVLGETRDYATVPVTKQTIVFEVTNACPMGCEYCFISKINKQERLKLAVNTEENVEKLLDYMRSADLDFDLIFHGGEPLLAKGLIKKVVDSIKHSRMLRNRVAFSMQTSGKGMTSDFLDWLIDNGVSIGVSVDGLAKGLRDSSPGIELLKMLNERGKRAGLVVVVNSSNQETLFEDFKKLYNDFGVRGFNYNSVISDNKHQLPDLGIVREQMEKITNYVLQNNLTPSLNPMQMFAERLAGGGGSLCYDDGCGGFKRIIAFSTDGKFYACDSLTDNPAYKAEGPGEFAEKRKALLKDVIKMKTSLSCSTCKYGYVCCLPCIGKVSLFGSSEKTMKQACEYNKVFLDILVEKTLDNPLNLYHFIGLGRQPSRRDVLLAYSRPSAEFHPLNRIGGETK